MLSLVCVHVVSDKVDRPTRLDVDRSVFDDNNEPPEIGGRGAWKLLGAVTM